MQKLSVGRTGHGFLIIRPTPTTAFAVTKMSLQLESSSPRIIQKTLTQESSFRSFKARPVVTFGINNFLSGKIKVCLYIPKGWGLGIQNRFFVEIILQFYSTLLCTFPTSQGAQVPRDLPGLVAKPGKLSLINIPGRQRLTSDSSHLVILF